MDDAAVAEAVLVLERPGSDEGEDLHGLVGMGAEALAGQEAGGSLAHG